jgi:glyoxylase-like metal-dependent hydrolase (beta-lactamase superfamily II)
VRAGPAALRFIPGGPATAGGELIRKERSLECTWITDSVLPIVAARREVVKSDHQFCDIVKLLPTPGHTIDHYSDQFGKPGADTVITGGKIHSPLQARFPELGMRVDYSFPQAGESHGKLFGFLCDTVTLVCTEHFPSPSSGRMKHWGDGLRSESV